MQPLGRLRQASSLLLLTLYCSVLASREADQLTFEPIPPTFVRSGVASLSSSSINNDANALVRYTWLDWESFQAGVQLTKDRDMDVWRTSAKNKTLDVRISLTLLDGRNSSFFQDATTSRLEIQPVVQILIPDLSLLAHASPSSAYYNQLHSSSAISNLTKTTTTRKPGRILLDDPIHDSYHPYENIITILQEMASANPNFARMVPIGNSSEGTQVWGLKVTNFSATAEPTSLFHGGDYQTEVDNDMDEVRHTRKKKNKKHKKQTRREQKLGFVITGAQHAREWIAPSTVIFFAHKMLLATDPLSEEYDSPTIRHLLNEMEFTFIPVVNVDGYKYTWTTDRLWRKNRQPVGDGCFGVDLNRQWGYKWSAGSRPNPCSDAYPGSAPFQATELQALTGYLSQPTNNVVAFLDLHSFGQMLMFPYSYSCDVSSADEENHFEAVVGAAKALRAVHGRNFEVGSVCSVSLTSPGESIDWTYSVQKIKWSFAAELRDFGIYGFLLPPSQIRASGEELSAAILSLADFVQSKEPVRSSIVAV